jgi:hypothetical protein
MSQQEVLVTVTVDALNVRAQPTEQSTLIATYSLGSVLNYVEVVDGEEVAGNPRWGHSAQGHYFWLGGTDHPNGTEILATVTVDALNVRSAPTEQSTLVTTYPRGSILNYYEVVQGETVAGNPRWGRSVQGHYFWLGGTDHPNG